MSYVLRFRLAMIAMVAVPALLLAACGEPPPAAPPARPAVTAVTLEARPVTLTRELPGRITPYLIAEVRPQVTGIVEERLFEEGAVVSEGQALYQLDDAMYRAAHNSAKAALARAEASVEVARLNAERAAELVKTDAVSRQEHQNAMATWRQAQADVGVAEARVESTAVELGYARITSPIAGRIGKSAVTKGALVTANQAAPLTRVQTLDPVYVDLTQSASELLELRRQLSSGVLREADDLPVTVLLEDGMPFPYEGRLTFADVAVDPMTGSFSLRAVVPNPDHVLMPGMYVRAVVSNAVLERGLLVPQQGIARDAKGNASAMVVTDGGTVERRAVTVRRTIGDDWLVDEGLTAGDRVIVEGLQKIQPGMTVEVTEAATEDAEAPGGPAAVRSQVPDADSGAGEPAGS